MRYSGSWAGNSLRFGLNSGPGQSRSSNLRTRAPKIKLIDPSTVKRNVKDSARTITQNAIEAPRTLPRKSTKIFSATVATVYSSEEPAEPGSRGGLLRPTKTGIVRSPTSQINIRKSVYDASGQGYAGTAIQQTVANPKYVAPATDTDTDTAIIAASNAKINGPILPLQLPPAMWAGSTTPRSTTAGIAVLSLVPVSCDFDDLRGTKMMKNIRTSSK